MYEPCAMVGRFRGNVKLDLRMVKPTMADHSVRFDAIPTDSLVARAPGLANPKNVTGAPMATRHKIVGTFDNTRHLLAFLTT